MKRGPVEGDYEFEVGDFVTVVNNRMLQREVGVVIGKSNGRLTVQSLSNSNITVTLLATAKVRRERCTDPEHVDCLVSDELALSCAIWKRQRLGSRT